MIPVAMQNLSWLEPWQPISPGLEAELLREVGSGHPLAGARALAVGRRMDTDDVLFYLPAGPELLAIVHLTWSGQRERDPHMPRTELFQSVEAFVDNRMHLDHDEFSAFS